MHCFYISCLMNIVYTLTSLVYLLYHCVLSMYELLDEYCIQWHLFPILNHKPPLAQNVWVSCLLLFLAFLPLQLQSLVASTRCLERTMLLVSRTQTKRAADTNWKRSRIKMGPVILLHQWEEIPKHQIRWNDWGMRYVGLSPRWINQPWANRPLLSNMLQGEASFSAWVERYICICM